MASEYLDTRDDASSQFSPETRIYTFILGSVPEGRTIIAFFIVEFEIDYVGAGEFQFFLFAASEIKRLPALIIAHAQDVGAADAARGRRAKAVHDRPHMRKSVYAGMTRFSVFSE
jgi:hypothetical protein